MQDLIVKTMPVDGYCHKMMPIVIASLSHTAVSVMFGHGQCEHASLVSETHFSKFDIIEVEAS